MMMFSRQVQKSDWTGLDWSGPEWTRLKRTKLHWVKIAFHLVVDDQNVKIWGTVSILEHGNKSQNYHGGVGWGKGDQCAYEGSAFIIQHHVVMQNSEEEKQRLKYFVLSNIWGGLNCSLKYIPHATPSRKSFLAPRQTSQPEVDCE